MPATLPIHASFDPIVDLEVRVLVLGSLPGAMSLAQKRYYAHPRNQFWRLMGAVIGQDLAAIDYQDRLDALLRAHVGLWDVVASARRTGSLDARIRDHRPNRLAELVAGLPAVAAVAFNGGTAAAIGARQLNAAPDVEKIALPSSSPAYTLAFAAKCERWLQLRRWL